ncbi:hypothetical protein RB5874 [Rhodopirellula baltica SH 1]|uniref:Uncharacterized protein n=1 Tax=Rhodopirellula baltica (strain DSM 10527 / NCIMB 13988 / SH1) TaxID=243090 RepID=Q7UR58_RHOBA|nr:hypothetical protein RB5874 [Rhodopirellula baltica SH 1]
MLDFGWLSESSSEEFRKEHAFTRPFFESTTPSLLERGLTTSSCCPLP